MFVILYLLPCTWFVFIISLGSEPDTKTETLMSTKPAPDAWPQGLLPKFHLLCKFQGSEAKCSKVSLVVKILYRFVQGVSTFCWSSSIPEQRWWVGGTTWGSGFTASGGCSLGWVGGMMLVINVIWSGQCGNMWQNICERRLCCVWQARSLQQMRRNGHIGVCT